MNSCSVKPFVKEGLALLSAYNTPCSGYQSSEVWSALCAPLVKQHQQHVVYRLNSPQQHVIYYLSKAKIPNSSVFIV